VSIHALREHGLRGVTMRYENGGATQVFKMGEKEIRVSATATLDEILAAFKEQK
jgi:hypothetical protein